MAGRAGTRRVVLLFAVLAGLFLMHGLDAPAMHGMPMPMQAPASMPAQMSAPKSDSAAMAPHTEALTMVSSTGAMQAGMNCIPLRPEGMASLFLALFLLVITQWRPRLSLPLRPIHSHWPHGPPRTGTQILRTLSISRT